LLFAHLRVRPPSPAELEGDWRGTIVLLPTAGGGLLNQVNPAALHVSFHNGTAKYRLAGGTEFAGSEDPGELRRVDEQTVIGRWTLRDLSPELFLGLQNHLGSGKAGLEICFVLTRP
jgi:hypothetical protein